MKTKLKNSSRQWLHRQGRDAFVKQARKDAWRSRAAFKLIQLNERDRFLFRGQTIADLGAAPGSWTQVCVGEVSTPTKAGHPDNKHNCSVIAIDKSTMSDIAGAEIITSDLLGENVDQLVHKAMQKNGISEFDVVLSDLSPNISGIRDADDANAEMLWLLALKFCKKYLKQDGVLVCKLFQGGEANSFTKQCMSSFSKINLRKPPASRKESRELFLVARGYRRTS